ncbi:MAG: FixH family protein [Gammaproteobacteria bacterium]|nr:FixH family protein [Gammaproteobacteria bacterium]
MQREDTDPWYRQFWPWFIIALPASAVVAGLYTLWLAGQTTDSLVIRSDDGIDVVTERNTLAEQAAIRLGIRAVVKIQSDTGAVVVTVSAPPGTRLSTSLELQLRHPTMASRDAVIDLQPAIPGADGEPTWAGHFQSPPAGRYYLFLSPGDTLGSEDAWRLSGVWSGQATLNLDPAFPDSNGSP